MTHRCARTSCFALIFLLGAHGLAAQATFNVYEADITQLQAALQAKTVTSVQLIDAYLARIAAFENDGPALNALVHINARARADAAALDAERARSGARGPLHGIPILLKDNFDTHDMPTTGSSIALAGLVPPRDAHQVKKLRDAGAIILGKTNLHELAAGILTISSLGGQTRNPYDPTRNPGGSSGGTAAAVAASFAAIGWGSDTCGSIRIPSAYNALFGLRPTKGLSSIAGIIPLSHTQDVAGPLARTVTDLAIGLDATIGADTADSATLVLRGRTLPRFGDNLDANALKTARIGVLAGYFGNADADREVGDVVRAAIDRMKQLGATIVDVHIANLDSLVAGTATIDHEFKFDLMDYLAATPGAQVSGLGDILDRRLYHSALEATFRRRNAAPARVTDAYTRALARRDSLHTAVLRALDDARVDAIVYPVIRRKPAVIPNANAGANCQLSASTGMPAIAAPAGFTADSLPVGMELLGRRFSDARLVAFAYAWEQAQKPRRAPASTPPLNK